MSRYEIESIGNIIMVKNLIFKNTITNKKEIDYAWELGRPCIIIYSDNEYDYFLTITTSQASEKFEYRYFKMENNDFMYLIKNKNNKNKINKVSRYINLKNIYKMPICGHEVVNKITFLKYREVITKLKKYHDDKKLIDIVKTATDVRKRK